jgi:ABC-type phosphate/phosphonate transport system substrate-binding protein
MADVPQARTTQQQVAAASAVAERMSASTLDASLDALVAILVAGPDVASVSDLAGKKVAIDDRYSEQSISRVRTAMAAAGADEVQLSKGQTTAIDRLVGKEVAARSSAWSRPAPQTAFPNSRD